MNSNFFKVLEDLPLVKEVKMSPMKSIVNLIYSKDTSLEDIVSELKSSPVDVTKLNITAISVNENNLPSNTHVFMKRTWDYCQDLDYDVYFKIIDGVRVDIIVRNMSDEPIIVFGRYKNFI